MNKHFLNNFIFSMALIMSFFGFITYDTVFAQIRDIRTDSTTDVMRKKSDLLKADIKDRQKALKDAEKKRMELTEPKGIPSFQDELKDIKDKRMMLREDIKKGRDALRDQIKEKRDFFRDEAKDRIDSLKDKISEDRARKVEGFFETMVRKFEAAINRLTSLADRIESRIDKFEDEGKDVSILRKALDKAKIAIDEAEASLDKAKEEFNVLAQNDKPQEYFFKVKEIVAVVAKNVKSAHKALVDVINIMSQSL